MGEGPYYEETTGELRFVDIIKKEIHTVSLEQGPNSHKVTKLDYSVGYAAALFLCVLVERWTEQMKIADFGVIGGPHSITADIKDHEGEYIVAAKLGFAIFNKSTSQLRYIKRVYDDPVTAKRFGSKFTHHNTRSEIALSYSVEFFFYG